MNSEQAFKHYKQTGKSPASISKLIDDKQEENVFRQMIRKDSQASIGSGVLLK